MGPARAGEHPIRRVSERNSRSRAGDVPRNYFRVILSGKPQTFISPEPRAPFKWGCPSAPSVLLVAEGASQTPSGGSSGSPRQLPRSPGLIACKGTKTALGRVVWARSSPPPARGGFCPQRSLKRRLPSSPPTSCAPGRSHDARSQRRPPREPGGPWEPGGGRGERERGWQMRPTLGGGWKHQLQILVYRVEKFVANFAQRYLFSAFFFFFSFLITYWNGEPNRRAPNAELRLARRCSSAQPPPRSSRAGGGSCLVPPTQGHLCFGSTSSQPYWKQKNDQNSIFVSYLFIYALHGTVLPAVVCNRSALA
ncbi:fascin isoform X1 [Apteryx rowi]|uniref:fascin isoform X1 n=1 Tax=Apteryx rowi TaxID=308060 RepID=UPI000E1C41BB|nr:fascin isoform X1 [Apteryx rowi]